MSKLVKQLDEDGVKQNEALTVKQLDEESMSDSSSDLPSESPLQVLEQSRGGVEQAEATDVEQHSDGHAYPSSASWS